MKQDDELSLLDLVKLIQSFYTQLRKQWFLLLLAGGICAGIGLIVSLISVPEYTAKTTMMLESSKAGNLSGALALANQFGLMSGGSSVDLNEDKLIDLIKSETILKIALLKKATINDKTDLLANHFIEIFGYSERWEKDNIDSLKNFRFVNSIESLNLIENQVLNLYLYGNIINNMLVTEKTQSGIIIISIKTKSEVFSKVLNEAIIESLTSYYVDRITEKGRADVKIIQNRVDSIALELKKSEQELARWKDGNLQLIKAQGMMEEFNLRRNVEVNNSIYLEGVKQLEISKFTLLQDTPFIQIIDKPTLPIRPKVLPKKKAIMIGGILGLFLASLFVILKKYINDIITEEKTKTKQQV